MKRPDFAATARALVAGSGQPRIPAQIVVEVERALREAYDAGRREALPAARERALVELRTAVEGARQGLAHVERTVEQSLAEMGKESG